MPPAVFDLYHHRRTIVVADVVRRTHIDDSLCGNEIMGVLNRITQGLTERGGGRLCHLQGNRDGAFKEYPSVPSVGCKYRGRSRTENLFVAIDEVERDFLGRAGVS